MGCGRSKEKKEKQVKTKVNSNVNKYPSYDDIGEEEEWAAIKQKSRIAEEERNPESMMQSIALSLNLEAGGRGGGGGGGGEEAVFENEHPEWRFECVQRMEIDRVKQRHSLLPCRSFDPSIVAEVKEISSLECGSQALIESKLQHLLKEEVAKEVLGKRTTLPRTFPAKKQLAVNILLAKGRLLRRSKDTNLVHDRRLIAVNILLAKGRLLRQSKDTNC